MVSSPPATNPPGLTLQNSNEANFQDAQIFSASPPVPSHSTPALSLHSTNTVGQHAFGAAATADLNPSAVFPRSPGKRPETYPAAVNGDIPLMTSASDPLPIPRHISDAVTVFQTVSPSPHVSKPLVRASPPHINIKSALSNSATPSPSARLPSASPVLPTTPVSPFSWPPSAGSTKSPHIASGASAPSSGTESELSPLAPLFVPQHCSASNNLVSVYL